MPSTDAAAEIASALSNGQAVQLAPGFRYELAEPLWLPPGAVILGDADHPPTLAAATNFAAAGGADDPANALVRGWATAVTATFLTQKSFKATRTLEVNDPEAFVVGQWVRVRGTNVGSDMAGVQDGGNVVKREVAQIVDLDGTVVYLSAPLSQTHGAGSLVEVIDPLLDVRIINVQFDASETPVATGLYIADAVAPEIDVAVRSFSRSGVELLGSRDGVVRVAGHGECNAVLFLDSVCDTDAIVRTTSGGGRTHPQGVPRGLVTMRHRCSGVVLADSRLENGCTGISIWGGTGITIRDCEIRDMRLHERAARDLSIPRDHYGEAMSAAGIEADGFMSPSDDTEHGFGLAIRDVTIEDCRHPGVTRQASVLLVDQHSLTVDGLSIMNYGYYATTAYDWMCGLALVDIFNGTIDNLTIRGVHAPIRFFGGWVRCDFGKVEVQMGDALGDNYSATILLDCGGGPAQPTEIHFDDFSCGVTSDLLFVGGDFNPATAVGLSIKSLRIGSTEYADVMLARNMSGAPFLAGAVAELTAGPGLAAGLTVPTTAVPEDKLIVVNGKGLGFSSGAGWVLAAHGQVRSGYVDINYEVVPGDRLGVVPGSTVLVPGASPFLGIALEGRPAGSAKLVALS